MERLLLYMFFLVLLILSSQRIESTLNLSGDDEDSSEQLNRGSERGALPTFIEWLILVWVIGMNMQWFCICTVHTLRILIVS